MYLDLINAIQTLILEEPTILASPEDALYFRSSLKSPTKIALQVAPVPNTPPAQAIKPITVEPILKIPPASQTPEPILKMPPVIQTAEPITVEPVLKIPPASQTPEPILKMPPVIQTAEPITAEPVLKIPPASQTPEPILKMPPVIQTAEPITAEPVLKIPQLQPLPVPDSKPPNYSFRSLFQTMAPTIAVLQEIPSDAIAKKIATRWKTKNQIAPISILSLHEPPKQKALLIEIAKAIDVYFGPAKLIEAESIEKEKQWDTFLQPQNLKCIIACDYTLWQLNGLMQFYKETSSTQVRTLQGIPVFLLPDLSLYLKDPPLKRSLWKALCNKLSS